jgi:hypothetical protein
MLFYFFLEKKNIYINKKELHHLNIWINIKYLKIRYFIAIQILIIIIILFRFII